MFNGVSYDVFVVKIDSISLKSFYIYENHNKSSHQDVMANINKDSSVFAINAGISDSLCNSVGYFVNEAVQIKPVNLANGNGNFYLKPNGAFLISEKDAVICESSQINNFKNTKTGIQSGPMLLLNGTVNPQFNAASTNKNIRCGVGIFTNKNQENFVVFCISNDPVSFYNFSVLFQQKYKCSNALCLESAGSVMSLPYLSKATKNDKLVVCRYICLDTNK